MYGRVTAFCFRVFLRMAVWVEMEGRKGERRRNSDMYVVCADVPIVRINLRGRIGGKKSKREKNAKRNWKQRVGSIAVGMIDKHSHAAKSA